MQAVRPSRRTVLVMRGTVNEWSVEEGWGVLTAPDVPSDVFAHHVHIRGQEGFRSLNAGDAVEFEAIQAKQDEYNYRAVWVERVSGSQ